MLWFANWCVCLVYVLLLSKICSLWSCSGRLRSSNLLPFVPEHQHHHSLHDSPYHFNQISDTNWDIMTMTKGVNCYVSQMLNGPPHPNFYTLPLARSSLFSAHYFGAPNLLNTFLNDSYCSSLQRKLELWIFLALMWRLWEQKKKGGALGDNGGLSGGRQGRGQESECGGH